MQIQTWSDVLKRSIEFEALLPDEIRGRVKTLLLLHGMTDDYSAWQRWTSIERYAGERGFAVLMPEVKLSWYCDTFVGERYFEFIADEFPKLARRMMPCLSDRREDNFVAGLSMGGYGALKCALKRPGHFRAAACFSSGFDPAAVTRLSDPIGTPAYWRDVFGPVEDIPGSENDLFAAADALEPARRPSLYLWCGTEDFLYEMNARMRDRLRSLGYDMIYRETPGIHNWKYWDHEIVNALDFFDGRGAEICL